MKKKREMKCVYRTGDGGARYVEVKAYRLCYWDFREVFPLIPRYKAGLRFKITDIRGKVKKL